MKRPILYIVLIMLSHLTTMFATSNESAMEKFINKVGKINKKLTFKNNKADKKVSNDSTSTDDSDIHDEVTESAQTTEVNIDEKTDVADNRMSADGNGLIKKDREESLYQPIYSLENLDYYLRHPDKISPSFSPIRSNFLPKNIYNTDNSFPSKITDFFKNFRSLPSFYSKLPYEPFKVLNPTFTTLHDSIFEPERFRKEPTFTESKLPKVIKDFLEKASLLSDASFSANPLEIFRSLSHKNVPDWNSPTGNHLQQLSNNVNNKNPPLADRFYDKRFNVFNIQQASFPSSQGSQLPQELLDAINDFFNNISKSYEPKILKSLSTLVERLMNIHPFENLPSPQVHHSTYSSLLQQQSLAPTSTPTFDEDDYFSNNATRPDKLQVISSTFVDNNSIFPENSKNLIDDDDFPNDLASPSNTSSLVEQHHLINVPLLGLTTPPSKDVPQQAGNLPPNDDISSLIDNVADLVKDSLSESIPTIGEILLAGKNSQTKAGKPTDSFSALNNIPSDQTQAYTFLSSLPSANDVQADKSLLFSKNTLSPSKDTIVVFIKKNEKPLSNSLISLNSHLFNVTQSPGNLTFTDNIHSATPENNSTSDNLSLFTSVPNSEGYQKKNLDTTVYINVLPSLSTGINEHGKKLNVPKNKIPQNGQNEINAEEKVALVGETKMEKNPDCLIGSAWISKCHECNCSDDGFPNCNIIQDCELPPREKPMLCKPFTAFRMGECNLCTCSGDGVPICKFTDCYSRGPDNTEEFIQDKTLRERNEEIKEKSKRNDDLNDVLRSDDSDDDSDGKNNTSSDNKQSKFNFDDENFDTVNEYGQRRVGKRRSQEGIASQRCEIGTVWEINCFNCFCDLTGKARCDKIAHCTLLPYGKPPRCKPTVVFKNRCGGICKCDDEGEPWCDDC